MRCARATLWWPAVLLAVSAAGAEAPLRLDVAGAIRLALERNRVLTIAAKDVGQRELDVDGAATEFQWSVKPDTQAGLSGDGVEGRYGLSVAKKFTPGTTISASGGAQRLADAETNPWRSYLQIEVSQPLLRRAGRLAQTEPITEASERLRAARRQWEQQKSDVAMDVVRTFERMILLQRQLEFDRAFYGRSEAFHALTQAREKQGRATRVDALRVEMQRGEALSRLENNREELFSSAQLLAELVGAAPDATFELEPPPHLVLKLPSVDEALRTALARRLDYAQAQQDRRTGERQLVLARRGRLPDLSVVVRTERAGDHGDFGSSLQTEPTHWFAGLASDTDFNRTRERIAFRQAALSSDAAAETVALKERTIAREVQQILARCRRAETDLGIAGRNRTLSGSRAELARRLFNAGRGDHFSVTDAEDAEVLAESRLLAARAEASLCGYELMRTLGTLLESPADLLPGAAKENP